MKQNYFKFPFYYSLCIINSLHSHFLLTSDNIYNICIYIYNIVYQIIKVETFKKNFLIKLFQIVYIFNMDQEYYSTLYKW